MAALKSMKKTDSDITVKIISIIAVTLPAVYLSGHLSYVIEKTGISTDTPALLLTHIKIHPFDFFHLHPVVFAYAAGIIIIGAVGILTKTTVPKAQMKGMEKGSNDFMTKEEITEFLNSNTTMVKR